MVFNAPKLIFFLNEQMFEVVFLEEIPSCLLFIFMIFKEFGSVRLLFHSDFRQTQ